MTRRGLVSPAATARRVLVALPVLVLLVFAPNLWVLAIGWIGAVGASVLVARRETGRRRTVRQAVWHVAATAALPGLAVAAGVDRGALDIQLPAGLVLVACGAALSAIVVLRRGEGIIVPAAAVVAARAWLDTSGSELLRIVVALLTFTALAAGWRLAAIVDLLRRRPRSRRKALAFWRSVDVRLIDRAAGALGTLAEGWSGLINHVVPVSLADQARLALMGLVTVVAYLLWGR